MIQNKLKLFLFAVAAFCQLDATEVHFSPKGNIESKIVKHINREQRQLSAALYWFTSGPIAQALIAAKNRGVEVEIIVDQDTVTGIAGKAQELVQEGIPVFVYNGGNSSIMHHKFWIFSDGTLITGSFNPTQRANKANHENIIILEDADVASQYQQEFDRLKKICPPYTKRHAKSVWSSMRIDKTICDWLGI